MTDLRIYAKSYNTVLYIYGERSEIQINPEYQRLSDIWGEDKRQLLIDSLLNAYDLPKLYFHEFVQPMEIDGKLYRYAIIDGKQRLETIWGFIEGKFALANDFTYIHDESIDARGMTYADLALMHPKLKSRFDATQLPIVLIQTDDIELIEEMFSRLNEAVPLSAPEKRNALGGPLPPVIRETARHAFFTQKLPYGNKRYRHYDLATKFLYFESTDEPEDTQKVYLDWFVKDFKDRNAVAEAANLQSRVATVLVPMTQVFIDTDRLLNSVGIGMIYYLLFRSAIGEGWIGDLTRTSLEQFERERVQNRERAEEDITQANYELLEFDRLNQSPNNTPAIRYRLDVMKKHIRAIISAN